MRHAGGSGVCLRREPSSNVLHLQEILNRILQFCVLPEVCAVKLWNKACRDSVTRYSRFSIAVPAHLAGPRLSVFVHGAARSFPCCRAFDLSGCEMAGDIHLRLLPSAIEVRP
jgi:hypothetical protein